MKETPIGPKLSLLVMGYNISAYLGQCLDSIISQQVNFSYEILLADDCSTDSTAQVVKAYEEKYPDIIRAFYNKTNQGTSRNLCNLIMASKGEYIMQVDGDDYFTDNSKLQMQVDTLNTHSECALCFHNYIFVDSNGNNPQQNVHPFSDGDIIPDDYLPEHGLGACHSVLMRRSALPTVLPEWLYNSGFQVDYLIQCMAATQGKMYYSDKVMVAYRKHGTNTTTVTNRKRRLEMGTFNVKNLANFYQSVGAYNGAKFLRSILPKRYMVLGYFYLDQGHFLNFLRYFLIGFIKQPDLKLRDHKDMVYVASPDLAQKLRRCVRLGRA